LGNQRNSYNQNISLESIFHTDDVKLTKKDLIIENSNAGLKVQRHLIKNQFDVQLKETNHWQPTLSQDDFQRLLTNITSLRISTSFSRPNKTYLKGFSLTTAENIDESLRKNEKKAIWIEKCKCLIGYSGQNCENCDDGYRRELINGDSFKRCMPCTCNNHSNSCDRNTGKCNCIHHTTGDNCERCVEGYYGNPLNGNQNDCKKCQCPNDGPCAEIFNYQSNNGDVVCLNCPEGTQGNLCEMCEDGYFMNGKKCEKCICNENIDENSIGNCDTLNGDCLRCVYNTTGSDCEKCLPGYWGNASTQDKCSSCNCDLLGTLDQKIDHCDLSTGQCQCKDHVIGQQCNKCEENYWNLSSGNGCVECKCDLLGSINLTCNFKSGQCFCKPGVSGLKCDQCLPNYYNFSDDGCKLCMCDLLGSNSIQCDAFGKCECKKNIVGVKCDKCVENYYKFETGCLKCNDCYGLVVKKANVLRDKVVGIEKLLGGGPEEFETLIKKLELSEKLENLKLLTNNLHRENYVAGGSYDGFLREVLNGIDNITNQIKISDLEYESRKDEMESMESLDSLVGNAELELSSIQLVIEELETQVGKYDGSVEIFNRMQNISRIVRLATEINEEFIFGIEIKVNNEINVMKSSINKINQNQKELQNIKILSSIVSVEGLVVDSNELKRVLGKDVENYKKMLNKIDENKFDFKSQNNEIDKIENNDKDLRSMVCFYCFVFFKI
jgi:laminin gamma 1